MLTENKCDCMPLNSIGCCYFLFSFHSSTSTSRFVYLLPFPFLLPSVAGLAACAFSVNCHSMSVALLGSTSRNTHTRAHNSCSVTLHINSGEAGNNSFVKQVSMESWIMCLLCKMENFFDIAAIVVVSACVCMCNVCLCFFYIVRARALNTFSHSNGVVSIRFCVLLVGCFSLFFCARARSSPLVLSLFLFNSALFVTTFYSVADYDGYDSTMDRLVAADSTDWELFRLTVRDVKIISPCERRCDFDLRSRSLRALLLLAHWDTLWPTPKQLYFGAVGVTAIVSCDHVLSVLFALTQQRTPHSIIPCGAPPHPCQFNSMKKILWIFFSRFINLNQWSDKWINLF